MSQPPNESYGPDFQENVTQYVTDILQEYVNIRATKNKTVVFTIEGRRNNWSYIRNAKIHICEKFPVPDNYVRSEQGYHSYINEISQLIHDKLPEGYVEGATGVTCTLCNLGTESYPQMNLIFSDDVPHIINHKRPECPFDFGTQNIMQFTTDFKFKVLYLPRLQKRLPPLKLKPRKRKKITSLTSIPESSKETSEEEGPIEKGPTEKGTTEKGPTEKGLTEGSSTEEDEIEELLTPEEHKECSSFILRCLKAVRDKRRPSSESNVIKTTEPITEKPSPDAPEEGCIKSFIKLISPTKTEKDKGEKSVEPDDVSEAGSSTDRKFLSVAVEGIASMIRRLSSSEEDLASTSDDVSEAGTLSTLADSNLLSPGSAVSLECHERLSPSPKKPKLDDNQD